MYHNVHSQHTIIECKHEREAMMALITIWRTMRTGVTWRVPTFVCRHRQMDMLCPPVVSDVCLICGRSVSAGIGWLHGDNFVVDDTDLHKSRIRI